MPKPTAIMVVESSAATWAASTDVLEQDTFGQQIKQATYPRVLTAIAVVGDSALGEGITVKIGNETVAKLASTNATAFDSLDKHQLDAEVFPGEAVVINPTGASTTNKFCVYCEFDEHPILKIMKARQAQRGMYAGRYGR